MSNTLLCLLGYKKKNGCGLHETILGDKFKDKYLHITYHPTDSEKNIIISNSYLRLFTIYKAIKENHVTEVIYLFYTFPFFLYKIFYKLNYTIMIHDCIQLNGKNFTNLFFYALGLLNSIFSKNIIVPSISTQRELEKIYHYNFIKKKIVVIDNFLDEEFISISKSYNKSNKNVREDFFLIVGADQAGVIEFLIDIKKITDKKILITGNCYPERQIKKLKEINPKIVFLGYVEKPKLVDLYSKCLAVLYKNFHEGFGYVLCECLLTQTPIITNPNKNIEWGLGEYGIYYNDKLEYHTKIIDFLHKEDKYSLLKKSRNYILKKYNNQNTYLSYEKLFNNYFDSKFTL